jgi:hypothetical protein
MVRNNRITDSEKQLLHAVGTHPEASMKQLLEYTEYKWERTMRRKLNRLKELEILQGPAYDFNYTKLCKTPLYKLLCIVESSQNLDTVISHLKVIEPLLWIFPVMSSHKRMLNAGFLSTDNTAMVNILHILKDNNIITDFVVRVFCSKRMIECPNLFGDINPSLDTLVDPCDIPDMSLEQYDTEWNECDVRILPHLMKGERLINILRKENNCHSDLTYEQIKYSREKMVKHNLIKKIYSFYPFPPEQCVEFQLFLEIEDIALIPRIIYNFARGERVFKQYALFGEWGSTSLLGSTCCTSHPLFLRDLMRKLDEIDQITEKEIYQMRSFPPRQYYYYHPPEFKYFDFETQTLEYPYYLYEERIKEKIECEAIIQE